MTKGEKKLTMPMRTALAAVQVTLSAGDDMLTQLAAEAALQILDWDRLEVAGGSLEYRPYTHPEAPQGYVLCDGAGRMLFRTQNLIFMNRTLVPSQRVERCMAMGRGVWPVADLLAANLDDDLLVAELLG